MQPSNAIAAPTLPVSAPLTRLLLGFAVLTGSVLFFLGTSWDIQWHTFIGRDRTLIPPHIVMLAGVTLSGLSALASVVSETVAARRRPGLARHSTAFATGFQSSLGAYLAGFAALAAAIAFPLDSYWHALYGVDVAIWAPFHIMFIFGMALVALGAAYMFVSTAHLAEGLGARGTTRAAYGGAILALGTMLALLTLLLFDATKGALYPVLAGFLAGWVLVAAKYGIPWRWSATAVAVTALVLAVIVFAFVPPATDALVASEQLVYRRGNAAQLAVVALSWPLLPLLSAFLLDLLLVVGKVGQGLATRLPWFAVALVLLSGAWAPAADPARAIVAALAVGTLKGIVALAFGILGAWGGAKVGQEMGLGMRFVERS